MIAPTKEYVSEGGSHWYDPNTGHPHHEVPCKSRPGEMRPTTLKDARQLGLYPSVSGILKVMDQPGLRRWRDRQIAEAAYCFSEEATGGSLDIYGYVEKTLQLASDNMDVCRDKGSEVHGAIQRYFEDYRYSLDHPDEHHRIPRMDGLFANHIESATKALVLLGAKGTNFQPERAFASPLGYGGCTDYKTDSIVVDWKAVTKLEKKLDYWDRCAQIASYNIGIFGELRRGANVFIDSSTAEFSIREWSKEELQYGWELFTACFNLYRVVNRFDPVLNANQLVLSKDT